jgi:hypothetical protein
MKFTLYYPGVTAAAMRVLLFLCALASGHATRNSTLRCASARKTSSGWRYTADTSSSFAAGAIAARGCFEDGIVQGGSGWGRLTIHSNSTFADTDQAYAAGLVEGGLTCERINQRYHSWFNATYRAPKWPTAHVDQMFQWVQNQRQWVEAKAEAGAASSTFWSNVLSVLQQLRGLADGVAMCPATATAAGPLPGFAEILFMNSDQDLYELAAHLFPTVVREPRGHCRALVKVSADLSDVFIGHTTWEAYAVMLPVAKWYDMPLRSSVARVHSMTAYPGSLFSQQDWTLVSSGLVALSTTLPVLDNALFANLSTASVPGWIRFTVANRLAHNGSEWVALASHDNSGSYSNQWMLVDLNKFDPSRQLRPGFLTVAEQTPLQLYSLDATPNLLQGFWPSFNRPYIREVSQAFGYPAAVARSGEFWDYQRYCGACIFRRDAPKIERLDEMRAFMRYNEHGTDEICKARCPVDGVGTGACGIASRDDLNPGSSSTPSQEKALWERMPAGAIDAKLTTVALAKQMRFWAQAGPTHDSQPVFDWGTTRVDAPHAGQPDRWDFQWTELGALALTSDQR